MYWRIAQFPELAHVPAELRRRILQKVRWRAYPVIGLASAVFGLFVALVLLAVVVGLTGMNHPLPIFWPIWGGCAGAIYLFQIRFIRLTMRHTIAAGFKGQRLPFCLGCGYDLAGQNSDRCPECGRAIAPAPAAPAPTAPAPKAPAPPDQT